MAESGPIASSSRQRLDHNEWTPGAQIPTHSDQNYLPSVEEERYGHHHQSSLMRTSSIRTSMSNDVGPSGDVLRGLTLSNIRSNSVTPNTQPDVLPSLGQVHPSPHIELPQISLDINTISTDTRHGIDEYSGYDFLGDDLFAVLGSVVRPSEHHLSPQTFEENAQLLWQAFHGKPDAPFQVAS